MDNTIDTRIFTAEDLLLTGQPLKIRVELTPGSVNLCLGQWDFSWERSTGKLLGNGQNMHDFKALPHQHEPEHLTDLCHSRENPTDDALYDRTRPDPTLSRLQAMEAADAADEERSGGTEGQNDFVIDPDRADAEE